MIHEPDGHQLQRVLLNPLAWIHKSHQNIFASIVDLIKWKDLNPWRNCSYKSFLCKRKKELGLEKNWDICEISISSFEFEWAISIVSRIE